MPNLIVIVQLVQRIKVRVIYEINWLVMFVLQDTKKNHDLYEYFESAFVETSFTVPTFPDEANTTQSVSHPHVPAQSTDAIQPIDDLASRDWLDEIDNSWDQEPNVKKSRSCSE